MKTLVMVCGILTSTLSSIHARSATTVQFVTREALTSAQVPVGKATKKMYAVLAALAEKTPKLGHVGLCAATVVAGAKSVSYEDAQLTVQSAPSILAMHTSDLGARNMYVVAHGVHELQTRIALYELIDEVVTS